MKFPLLLALAAGAVLPAAAVETKYWQLHDRTDFEKGNFKKLALRSDGRITLAPEFRELLDSSTPYLWALAADSKGNLYAGGGGPGSSTAKLFVIDASGKSRTLAELEGMEIHAIAVDREDHVYAATSPDGKVYRVGAGGKSEVYYDPKAKYIWAIAFSSTGDLFVATGDQGEIHRVPPGGRGSVFFKTEETHARSLAVDGKNNLIVGTEPGGLILRVSPSGEGFVLHQAGKREVTAVAVARDGSIYAAAVGAKQPAAGPAPPASAPVPTQPSSPPPPGGMTVVQGRTPAQPPPTFAPTAPSLSGGSELIQIDQNGFPRRMWSDSQEIVYAIGFDASGRPVLGTGNKGRVFRVDSELLATRLLSADPTQITSLVAGKGGVLYATTGNIGKVYKIGPGLENEGSLESEAFDAGIFSEWGRLIQYSELKGGRIRFESRSGNLDRPQQNWSPWAPANGRIPSPAARFLQFRLVMTGNGDSPELRGLEIAYLPRNVAPQVEEIEITPANHRFPAQSLMLTPSQSLTLPPIGQPRRSSTPTVSESSVTMNYAKGFLGARWRASDQNGDALVYKVEIRGAGESEWKLLKEKVKEKQLSWDSTAFPDGQYRLRVTGSDEPDNPPAQALSRSLESDVFWIDNTPPRISGLSGVESGGKITLRWKAADVVSTIANAEYSVNGGDWLVVEPVTRLSDSNELEYLLVISKGAGAETTIAVRVTDEYDNQAVEKIVIR